MKREVWLKINKLNEEIKRLEKYADRYAIDFKDNKNLKIKINELKDLRESLFFKEKINDKLGKKL